MNIESLRNREMLIALRRILRAVEIHSRKLVQDIGLSGPQLFVLQALAERGEPMTAGALAQAVVLTQGTLTPILDRLERKHLLRRARGVDDRRKVYITLTTSGRRAVEQAPPLLHERFLKRFEALHEDDKNLLLSNVQRLAELMHAPPVEAPGLTLEPEPLSPNQEATPKECVESPEKFDLTAGPPTSQPSQQ